MTVVCARGCHAVFSNHQMGWLVSVSAAPWSLHSERKKKSPPDKLTRRQHMGEDGLACSKWPQGSHFPQCSNSPGSLVSICPLWAKVSQTHCGHHGLEEIWQIQKTDPVCLSPLRGERVARWYRMSLAFKDTSGVFGGLSTSLVEFHKVSLHRY